MFRTFSLVAAALAALLGLLVATGREARRARSIGPGPDRAGNRVERCVTCHVKPDEDPGGPHARAALGCASCHLGNRLAFEKERAHEGLEKEPGALSTVGATCGREGCHAREAARLASSPMVRAAGIVSVDRWVFGEIPTPDGTEAMADVLSATHPTPGQSHLRKLCAGCHLGTRRANRDDALAGSGSGCAACHVPLRKATDPPRRHPPVDARVPDERCFGCHSRSGRIALSYDGLAEVEPAQLRGGDAPCLAPTALPDGRPACRVTPDVHRAAGMSCVDCHVHTELMGDGTARPHKEQQLEVTCESCHGVASDDGANPVGSRASRRESDWPAPEARWASVDDPITRDLLKARGESRPDGEAVRRGTRGTPIWNLRPAAAGWTLTRKLDGKPLAVKATPLDADHSMKGHARLSCSACHTAWAPTCTTCHTAFDRTRGQWDFAAARETVGAWVERSGGFGWAPPALGVRADGRIVPAVPGMILTLDTMGVPSSSTAHRLFAPLEPHTTGKKARSCETCHRSSTALGLGTGTLDFGAAEPRFVPSRATSVDSGLADDGWTRLFPHTEGLGTRIGFRSLNADEQRRALAVGPCLSCHPTASDPIWRDVAASRARLSRASRCPFGPVRPAWLR